MDVSKHLCGAAPHFRIFLWQAAKWSMTDAKGIMADGRRQKESQQIVYVNANCIAQQALSQTQSITQSAAFTWPHGGLRWAIPAGGPHVLLKLEKAVLNYKKPVDRPLFQITLRDAWGEAVGQPVDTPPCTYDKSSGVFTAGHSVVLDTPVGDMPEGAALLPSSGILASSHINEQFIVCFWSLRACETCSGSTWTALL